MINDNTNHIYIYVQLISRPNFNEYVGYILGCHREPLLSKSTTQSVVHTDRVKKKTITETLENLSLI
jgi:hypothetical protein